MSSHYKSGVSSLAPPENPFIYPPFLLESVAQTEMVPSLLSVISNNKHQNLSLKPSSRSLLAKYGVKALILFYCVFSIKINVFINSQNVLVITIAEFQLMIKKQTRFGKKFKMPSILQIRSPSAENRGQCLKTKHIFMKPNIIKHE